MAIKPGRCLLKQRLREIRKDQQWLSDTTGIQVSDLRIRQQ